VLSKSDFRDRFHKDADGESWKSGDEGLWHDRPSQHFRTRLLGDIQKRGGSAGKEKTGPFRITTRPETMHWKTTNMGGGPNLNSLERLSAGVGDDGHPSGVRGPFNQVGKNKTLCKNSFRIGVVDGGKSTAKKLRTRVKGGKLCRSGCELRGHYTGKTAPDRNRSLGRRGGQQLASTDKTIRRSPRTGSPSHD